MTRFKLPQRVGWAKARSSKSAVADFDKFLVPKSGKPDFGAPCPPSKPRSGGHAELVIGPAHRVRPLAGPLAGSGRTRCLCPPDCLVLWKRSEDPMAAK